MSTGVPIGQAARESGVKVPTVRYYEEIGLLPAPVRSDRNRRLYGREDVRRLGFIRHARELGFGLDAIRTLLQLQDQPTQSCAAADEIVSERLTEVEQRIASLTALRTELQRMAQECGHGWVSDCRVIEVLADHGQCMHADH